MTTTFKPDDAIELLEETINEADAALEEAQKQIKIATETIDELKAIHKLEKNK